MVGTLEMFSKLPGSFLGTDSCSDSWSSRFFGTEDILEFARLIVGLRRWKKSLGMTRHGLGASLHVVRTVNER